jgi:hypothetical protein
MVTYSSHNVCGILPDNAFVDKTVNENTYFCCPKLRPLLFLTSDSGQESYEETDLVVKGCDLVKCNRYCDGLSKALRAYLWTASALYQLSIAC